MFDVVRHVIVSVRSVGDNVFDVMRHVIVCQASWR